MIKRTFGVVCLHFLSVFEAFFFRNRSDGSNSNNTTGIPPGWLSSNMLSYLRMHVPKFWIDKPHTELACFTLRTIVFWVILLNRPGITECQYTNWPQNSCSSAVKSRWYKLSCSVWFGSLKFQNHDVFQGKLHLSCTVTVLRFALIHLVLPLR